MRPADTTEDAWNVYLDVARQMPPSERIHLAFEMTESAQRMLADAVRRRHPDYSDGEVEWALRRRRIDDDQLFREAWPNAPLRAL